MGDNVPLEEEVVGNGSLAARYRDIVDAVRMRGHCTINDDVIPEMGMSERRDALWQDNH